MDVPDLFLSVCRATHWLRIYRLNEFSQLSKIMNYIQWTRAKIFTFIILFFTWSYFRHWLNFVILYSVLAEFDLMPYVSHLPR